MSEAIDILKSEKPVLMGKFGVEEIALFGSAARGEETPESDIDILVKRKIQTLENYFNILDCLESKLHRKIDLVTLHSGLSERFLRIIKKDLIYV
jgi:predicted nucleotidyltransferase